MKRLIAILCILAMVLAMVPVMSFAATTARFIVYSTPICTASAGTPTL